MQLSMFGCKLSTGCTRPRHQTTRAIDHDQISKPDFRKPELLRSLEDVCEDILASEKGNGRLAGREQCWWKKLGSRSMAPVLIQGSL